MNVTERQAIMERIDEDETIRALGALADQAYYTFAAAKVFASPREIDRLADAEVTAFVAWEAARRAMWARLTTAPWPY